jgi:hypothetical protein
MTAFPSAYQTPGAEGTYSWRVTAPPAVVGRIPILPPHPDLIPDLAVCIACPGRVRRCAVGP